MKQVIEMGKLAGLLALALSLGACSGESAEMAANAHPGQSTYNEACISCHNPGISGAPRLGDTDAWQARAAKGPGSSKEAGEVDLQLNFNNRLIIF